jgi:hypothetical protein
MDSEDLDLRKGVGTHLFFLSLFIFSFFLSPFFLIYFSFLYYFTMGERLLYLGHESK